jgi:esterase/lipase superfamily enzyme
MFTKHLNACCGLFCVLLVAVPSIGRAVETKCRVEFFLNEWSELYKRAKGSGTISCDNGQKADVKLEAKGGGLAAGKAEIRDAKGEFEGVADIHELFGTYVQADASAGSVKNAAAVMTKGPVILGLKGRGAGWELGAAFGKLTISPKGSKAAGGGGGTTAPANSSLVQVFYVTDRAMSTGVPLDYGPRRGPVSFGQFEVSIPKDHRLARIERPSWWRFEFSEDPKKHFVIVGRRAETEEEFYRGVGRVVGASVNRDAFVFIHGFNVSFEDAVYRTAQLAYDLEFSGAAILYSWPSNARIADYVADSNNNDWTMPHLKEFLESVATRTGAKTVHLIAHSMGSRALSNVLAQIASAGPAGRPRAHFRQVVLAAADIDADIFRRLALAVTSTAERVTLYASSNDRALNLSKQLNGSYPRVGDVSGQVVIAPGVDTIDVSALDTDFIGHAYYGEHRSILTDLYRLVFGGDPPGRRFGLQQIRLAAGTYWKFRP